MLTPPRSSARAVFAVFSVLSIAACEKDRDPAPSIAAPRTLVFSTNPAIYTGGPDPTGRAEGRGASESVGDARRSAALAAGSNDGRAIGGPSLDLRKVMEQVHYAYRQGPDGSWNGGHTTYDVTLHDGALEVKPYHHPSGTPAGAAPRPASRTAAGARAHSTPSAEAVIETGGVRFARSVVERGSVVLASGEGLARSGAEGQLEIARGAIVEQLRNGPDGVEQSWRVAERPEGSGDLEVRIAVTAGAFIGESEHGVHIKSGRVGVRFGHAAWADALGVRTPVDARWAGGEIVLRVPAAVVEGSAYPAVLDPVIGPELDIDEAVVGPALSLQFAPRVASGGSSYLVVWVDYRARYGSDIYGARVSDSGEVLDVAGIPLSTGEASTWPAVAWDGTNYLVVWVSARGLLGARVSDSGKVLDPAGIVIDRSGTPAAHPDLAWDGTNYLVVWAAGYPGLKGYPPNYMIHGARVSGAGVVLDARLIAVSADSGDQHSPAVASDGTNFLVVWHRWSGQRWDVHGARVSGAGVVDSGFPISTAPNDKHSPALAWDGTSYLVVWRQALSSGEGDIYGARVSSAGVVLDTDGFAISAEEGEQRSPAVAWDGTNYLVAWDHARSPDRSCVRAARVSGAGVVQDATGITVSEAVRAETTPVAWNETTPAIAWNGTHHLVVWSDLRNAGSSDASKDIHGARVSSAGVVRDAAGIAISTAGHNQANPAVAWDGTQYLVVWEELRRSTGTDIYGARVSGAGVVLDAAGIAVSATAADQHSPAVAWDGTNFLVVWQEWSGERRSWDVHGARVSGAGLVLDPANVRISTSTIAGGPWVASNGTNYLVVWAGVSTVFGARVSSAGVVLDDSAISISKLRLTEPDPKHSQPAVATDGTDYFVVWRDDVRGRIYGVHVSGAGVVTPDFGRLVSPGVFATQPAIAWVGTHYLVVWESDRAISGARVSAEGSVLDAFGVPTTATTAPYAPAVVSGGSSAFVVWGNHVSDRLDEIRGARVRGSGAVDPELLLGTSSSRSPKPAVASGPARHYLVAYDDFVAAPNVNAIRVRARTVVFENSPPVATAPSVTTARDTAVAVTLAATDDDSDALTYAVVTEPVHGTLAGTGPSFTYTPAAGYIGADTFTFKANDGQVDSAVATVNIVVSPPPDSTGGPEAKHRSGCGYASSADAAPLGAAVLGWLALGSARRRRPGAGPRPLQRKTGSGTATTSARIGSTR